MPWVGIGIVAIFFLIHLFILTDYGISYDEKENFLTGLSYLKFFETRDKAYLTWSTDNPIFQGKELDPLFSQDHYFNWAHAQPGLNPFGGLIGAITYQIFNQKLEWLGTVDSFHLAYLILALFFSVFLLWFFWKKLSPLGAVGVVLLLNLSPFWFAHFHINPKDFPVAIFFTTGALAFFAAFYSQEPKRLIWFLLYALFFGLGLASKPNIAFLPIGLFLWTLIFGRKLFWWWLLNLFIFSLFGVLIMLLVWPFFLYGGSLIDTLTKTYIYFRDVNVGHAGFFWDKKYRFDTEMPHIAPLAYFVFKMPPAVLLLGVWGMIIAFWQNIKNRFNPQNIEGTLGLLLSILVLITLLRLIIRPFVYDGLRMLAEIVPLFTILAVMGWLNILKRSRLLKPFCLRLFYGATALVLLVMGITLIHLHPYQDIYYNFLIGGVKKAYAHFEIEQWGTSYREAANWLNQNVPEGSQLCLPVADHLIKFHLEKNYLYQCNVGQLDSGQYTFFIVRHDNENPAVGQAEGNYKPIFTIERAGAILLKGFHESPEFKITNQENN